MTQVFLHVRNFAEILLRGISQVFLLNNVITGVLFLAGVFYDSWRMGVGAVLGVFVGTLTALFLKYDKNEIRQGFYGYNGVLVGLALICFFGFNITSVIVLLFGSILSSIIRKVMSTGKLSPYTAPFIISTWISMLFIVTLKIIPLQTAQLPNASTLEIIPAASKGIGQVMFLGDMISGILVFIGVLVSSRITAFYALLGASIGAILAFLFSFPLDLVNMGLFGFNGVLCGIAFSDKKCGYVISAIAAITISVFITYGIMRLGIIPLTAPFVISTWLILLLRKKLCL